MNDNLKAFLEMAKTDPELGHKLAAMDVAGLIAIAKEKGLELSEADFRPPADEIEAAELNGVVGGSGGGACFVLGGGGGRDTRDNEIYGCACVVYGQGGDGRASDANCFCILGGVGSEDQDWIEKGRDS